MAERGHRVSVLSFADSEPVVRRMGLSFIPFGESAFPQGEWKRRTDAVSRLHGDRGSSVTIARVAAQAKCIVDDLPAALRTLKLDGLVMDQVCVGAEALPWRSPATRCLCTGKRPCALIIAGGLTAIPGGGACATAPATPTTFRRARSGDCSALRPEASFACADATRSQRDSAEPRAGDATPGVL
jgi:hypothetical protein